MTEETSNQQTQEEKMKPTVFISYNHKSAMEAADELEERITPISNVKRDKHLDSWADLILFMESIKDQDFAVLFISDEFLKSEGCMYEVINLMKKPGWADATMYVVMDNARKIYQPEGQIDYIVHWKEEADRLQDKLDRVSNGDDKAYYYQINEVEKRRSIHNKMGEFLTLVARRKNPTIKAAFDDIVARVETGTRLLNNTSFETRKPVQLSNSLNLKIIEEPYISVPVAILLDTSGSMNGQILHTVKECLHEFVRLLREGTVNSSVCIELAIVTFSSGSRINIPFFPISDAMIDDDIDFIEAGGVTDLGSGIKTIYKLIMEEYSKDNSVVFPPKVILVTDGLPTDRKPYDEDIQTEPGALNIVNGTALNHEIVRESMYIVTKWFGVFITDENMEDMRMEIEQFLMPVAKIITSSTGILQLPTQISYFAKEIIRQINQYDNDLPLSKYE